MIRLKAGAMAHILRNKKVEIYDDELIVGCFTPHRVGGELYPELHGIAMLEDLFRFDTREVNPLTLSKRDRFRILTQVIPWWSTRFLALRAKPPLQALRFIADQMAPTIYLINETAGVGHFVPDYEGLIRHGTEGYRSLATRALRDVPRGSPEANFLEAVRIACSALEDFSRGYRDRALHLHNREQDPKRKAELAGIAAVCDRVPRRPARTFQEALQSILFAQIGINLESLDNGISPGRLDQILWERYSQDLEKGRIDREQALELLGCFLLKLCEIVPALSQRVTRFHGGMMSGQAVVIGGMDERGEDATNELTWMFLTLMDRIRMRQPNYHARIHGGSPPAYRQRIASVLASGSVSPAIYNDETIIPILKSRGASLREACNYATVGCVEPVIPGMSFQSTDAALFNLPICLELALNGGRRFGHWRRTGRATRASDACVSMKQILGLLSCQIAFALDRLSFDLGSIERANARLHPTPLSSMLIRGCVASRRDATEGGAVFNGSGIQGVGVIEVGDSLTALETVVFKSGLATMKEVVEACKRNFSGFESLRNRLRNAPKYGNDDPIADRNVGRVMEILGRHIDGRTNARGGSWSAGYYSMTSHHAFGERVGALPSGRLRGEPFSSGISPSSGAARQGPTASLRSQAELPLQLAPNGVNFNLELDPWIVQGPQGEMRLQWLIDGAFKLGCMQAQVTVIDRKILLEARDQPGLHPGLLVRVSGYCARFDDLSPEMKQEVIDRTFHSSDQGTVGR